MFINKEFTDIKILKVATIRNYDALAFNVALA